MSRHDRVPRVLSSDRSLWERQVGETAKAFKAFCAYRDLGTDRSLVRVAAELNKTRSMIEDWSSRWQWASRCAAYDDDVERRRRATNEEASKRMLEAHAQEVVAARRATMEPIRALLKRLANASEADYQSLDDRELSELVQKAVRSLAQLQQAERLARGLPGESIEHVGDPARPLVQRGAPHPDLSRLSILELEVLDLLHCKAAGEGIESAEHSTTDANLVVALTSWIEALDPTAAVVVKRLRVDRVKRCEECDGVVTGSEE